MARPTVDLSAHINHHLQRGHPADFPVSLVPVFHRNGSDPEEIPSRRAVVRQDTGEAIAVVSNRYRLVPHQRILEVVEQALVPLDVGPVPRGIYVDRGGARMRALFKFPELAKPVRGNDTICPCLKIHNTYDGTSRIGVHIGAFRFVCTNLAVGGGGVFAGGFMAVHAGEIPLDEVASQLASYLLAFDEIVALYRSWIEQLLDTDRLCRALDALPKTAGEAITETIERNGDSQSQMAFRIDDRSDDDISSSNLGPPGAAAVMCAATPMFTLFVNSLCGPDVALRQLGFEHRIATLLATLVLTAWENSSRAKSQPHVTAGCEQTDANSQARECCPDSSRPCRDQQESQQTLPVTGRADAASRKTSTHARFLADRGRAYSRCMRSDSPLRMELSQRLLWREVEVDLRR